MKVKVTCAEAKAPVGRHASYEAKGLGGVGGCGIFWANMTGDAVCAGRCPKCGAYSWAGVDLKPLKVGKVGRSGCDASCRGSDSTKCNCSCGGERHGELLNEPAGSLK